ncbi:unnamed protein product [Discula destructiva]
MDPPSKRRRLLPTPAPTAAPAQAPVALAPAQPVPPPATTHQQTQYPAEQPRQQLPHQAGPSPPPERHEFESFARHLQDAAMHIYGKMQRPPRYKNVSVLLLRWEEDTAAQHELVELEKTFRERYNYHTEKWSIPTVPNPSIKLNVQMAPFIEHAGSDHLLIVYYAGHSYVGSDKQLYWASNTRENASRLKWDGVRCLVEDAQCDMLLLLDAMAVHDSDKTGQHGIKQAIAAYSLGQKSSDCPSRSFTSYLSASLCNLSSGRPYTVQRLHEEIMRLRQLDISALPVNGGGARPPPPERTPTLFTLAPGQDQPLTLSPLQQKGARAQEHPPPAGTNGHCEREGIPFVSGPVPDLTFDEARVLVCTTFVGDASPDMVFYKQWMHGPPPLASKITMEGMFLGPPTMLLVSMPLSVWGIVQHDKVCCFLGYINSHNMIDLYNGLVKSTPVSPGPPAGARTSHFTGPVIGVPNASSGPVHQRALEDGRMLLEASQTAANGQTMKRRHESIAQQATAYSQQANRRDPSARNPLPNSAPPTNHLGAAMRGAEESAEVKEAAEQLKALSHVRHASDGGLSAGSASDRRYGDSPMSVDGNEFALELQPAPPARKPLAKAQPKYDNRCTLCGHAPFKDSSSLRKHIAAAHTRPFPCAFSFAGCTSTFGSKNEWKRHISSQHLCLTFYRCSSCPASTAEGKGNEFNRKDLFTQHLRRMHAPFAIKKSLHKANDQMQMDWDTHVKEMHVSCLVTRREPPQHVACPKPECGKEFEGHIAWDEWTEHVGRHMEKGDGLRIKVDDLLAKWALKEGIIERTESGEYKFASQEELNGFGSMSRRGSLANTSYVSSSLSPKLESKAEKRLHPEPPPQKEQQREPALEPRLVLKPGPEPEKEPEPEESSSDETEDNSQHEESNSTPSNNNTIQAEIEPDDPDSIVVATTVVPNR